MARKSLWSFRTSSLSEDEEEEDDPEADAIEDALASEPEDAAAVPLGLLVVVLEKADPVGRSWIAF